VCVCEGWRGEPEKGLAIRGVLTAAVLLCAAGGKVNSSLHQSIGRSCACSREFWSVWGLAINQSVKQSINQSINQSLNQGLLHPAVALAHCTSTLSRAIPYSNKSLMRNPVLDRTVLAIYQRDGDGPGEALVPSVQYRYEQSGGITFSQCSPGNGRKNTIQVESRQGNKRTEGESSMCDPRCNRKINSCLVRSLPCRHCAQE